MYEIVKSEFNIIMKKSKNEDYVKEIIRLYSNQNLNIDRFSEKVVEDT